MRRLHRTWFLALALTAALTAQDAANIRNPHIDTESPEGQLLLQAGQAENADGRIGPLEKYLSDYAGGEHEGYVLMQLAGAYNEKQDFPKVSQYGERLLKIAPEDLEVRHMVNQALLQSQNWDGLKPRLLETGPIAERQLAAPKPSDEEEAAAWEAQKEYAEGVAQWLEWAANAAMVQQTDPQSKIAWLDLLRESYPESQYAQGLESQYLAAYQQMGDQANMLAWMKKAVEAGSRDPGYLYSLAEDALAREDRAEAKSYADQALEALESGPKPEGYGDEQWEEQKAKLTAYSRFVLGRVEIAKDNKDAYRAARAHLLPTVDVLKAEGGPRYHVLAYLLGVCYVHLDIQGDNIARALQWMGEAAKTDGPFKQQAAEAVKKIRAAQ